MWMESELLDASCTLQKNSSFIPANWFSSDVLCAQFFAPIEPLHIDIELTRGGRASGDAVVEFESDGDVREAMKRHREMMGQLSLYITVIVSIIVGYLSLSLLFIMLILVSVYSMQLNVV